MTAHLGAAVTAFVDGELADGAREEVLVHLTHCVPCRAEVDALRRFKQVLRAEPLVVPFDLSARLLSTAAFAEVSAFCEDPASRPAARPVRWGHGGRRSHSRLRRTAVSGALVAMGLGGALSIAGPPPRGPVAPVDPANAGFVLDHGATSHEVPFTELDVVSVSSNSSPSGRGQR